MYKKMDLTDELRDSQNRELLDNSFEIDGNNYNNELSVPRRQSSASSLDGPSIFG
jgi:hypothetical protein